MMIAQRRILTMNLPRTLVFGAGCAARCADDLLARRAFRVFVIASPSTRLLGAPIESALRSAGGQWTVWSEIRGEPTIETFRSALSASRDARADAVVGLGGGSAMDVAKLVAALLDGKQDITDVFGIGKLAGRSNFLVCLPTTAGTGSEVSPNAILLDERDQLKKGAISSHLMPDAAYVDPLLTLGVPPAVTAATGIDALVHCIEAYANKFAHPMIDLYALQGVRLIAANLPRAVADGNDIEARTNLALASMYGGICLGPVNTGAVHALAYPLGGEFHVAHGVSNAVLLPHVLEFNLPAAPARYADIAIALGAERAGTNEDTARRGLQILRDLCRKCGIPASLAQLNVPRDAIDRMASAAMTVTRLLNLNVREVTLADARDIYHKAFAS
jgi:alcohol dehydrogenase class IV